MVVLVVDIAFHRHPVLLSCCLVALLDNVLHFNGWQGSVFHTFIELDFAVSSFDMQRGVPFAFLNSFNTALLVWGLEFKELACISSVVGWR